MPRETDSLALPTQGALDQIAAIKTLLTGAKLHLTKVAQVINRDTTHADLAAVEADFSGYPAGGVVLTWSVIGMTQDGRPVIASQRVRFQAADPTTVANAVYNAWVATPGAAGPPVVDPLCEFACTFQAGKTLDDPYDFVDVTVYVARSPSGDGVEGWVDVEN